MCLPAFLSAGPESYVAHITGLGKGPTMFKRFGAYYVTTGSGCCASSTCRSAHLLLERYAKWEVFSLGFIIVQTKQNPRILHIKMHMAPGDGTWDGASCSCSYSCKCKFKFRFLCLLTSMLCYIPIPPHTTVPFLLRPIAIRWRTWHLACEYVRV